MFSVWSKLCCISFCNRIQQPAACLCRRASLSMLKGFWGSSSKSQLGHTEAWGKRLARGTPQRLWPFRVGGSGLRAELSLWRSRREQPTAVPRMWGSLCCTPGIMNGRGGEIRREDCREGTHTHLTTARTVHRTLVPVPNQYLPVLCSRPIQDQDREGDKGLETESRPEKCQSNSRPL